MARFNAKQRISINLKDNRNNDDNKFPQTIVQSRHGAIQQKAQNFNKFERQHKQQ
jgi:hypothetical protein